MPATVLVVDDDIDICEALRSQLEWEQYEVSTAKSAESAIRLLDAGLRPCAIILDSVMPGMSGADFMQWISQRPDEVARISIVVFTASASPEGFDAARAIIQKPGKISELLHLVADCCPARAALRIFHAMNDP